MSMPMKSYLVLSREEIQDYEDGLFYDMKDTLCK